MTDFDDEFLNAFADDFVDLDTIGDPFTGLSADFDLQRSTKNADSMATNSAQPSPDFLDSMSTQCVSVHFRKRQYTECHPWLRILTACSPPFCTVLFTYPSPAISTLLPVTLSL